MQTSIQTIAFVDLLWILIPVFVVGYLYLRWMGDGVTILYALARMLLQLVMIGYVLGYIFNAHGSLLVVMILFVMLMASSVIALRVLTKKTPKFYMYTFISIATGGVLTLFIVLWGVMKLPHWYEPRVVIPLAGMIFANAMNAVSIAAERFESERDRGVEYRKARALAYKAALIPIINALFAVGLVSLPGMMTGQILSGVDPLIAVRYQMMVMLMILASAGISAALFLTFIRKHDV